MGDLSFIYHYLLSLLCFLMRYFLVCPARPMGSAIRAKNIDHRKPPCMWGLQTSYSERIRYSHIFCALE